QMHKNYLTTTSNITAKENGKFDLDLTFPQGQHIVSFEFDGQTLANPKTSLDEKGNTISIYTVEVDSPVGLYEATVDLHVKASIGGQPFEYQEVYDVQVQIGGVQNPFQDVTNSYAYK